MQFQVRIPVESGQSDPDPRVNPEQVPSKNLTTLKPAVNPQSGGLCTRFLATLEAPAGATATVSLYAADEGTIPPQTVERLTPAILAGRRFYEIASGVALASGVLTNVPDAPSGGTLYVRVTAASAAGTVLVSCAG